MDVLSTYLESKEQINAIAKERFLLLEANDPFGIIRNSDIVRLEINEHKKDDSLVVIDLLNYHEEVPRVTFSTTREIALGVSEEILKDWIEASKNLIESTYRTVLLKFFKNFEQNHFEIVNAGIQVAPTLSAAGKTNAEIADIVAKHMTTKKANQVLQKQCTDENYRDMMDL